MPQAPTPSRAFLEALVRKGVARGIPVELVEDLVMEAWERSAKAFDPSRGSFEALLLRVAENGFRYWWRTEIRNRKRRANLIHHPSVKRVVVPLEDPQAHERAAANQRKLLERLDEGEKALFATWALQHHLPRGTLSVTAAAASLEMSKGSYDHAKRRLKTKILALLGEMGLQPEQLFVEQDHERPERRDVG